MVAAHAERWQRARLVARTPQTDRIVRLEFEVDEPRAHDPGSHVDVRLDVAGSLQRRSYSVVDGGSDGRRVALSVFRGPVSRGGAAAMHALEPGAEIEMTTPVNDFPLRLGAPRYTLVAGGVGITAILGMAERLRGVGVDYRLVYVGRSRAAMAYLDQVADHGDRAALHVTDEGAALSVDDLVARAEPGEEFYVCGPIRLMDAVRRSWIARGLPASNLRMETFGNSGWFEPQPFTVRIPALGAHVEVAPAQSIIEALEGAGVDVLSDCRKGECGLCEARVLELRGDIDHRDVFYSERQRDARSRLCLCVSRVVATGDAPAEIVIQTS